MSADQSAGRNVSNGDGDGRGYVGAAAIERQSVGLVFGGCESHADTDADKAGMGHAAVSIAADREVNL